MVSLASGPKNICHFPVTDLRVPFSVTKVRSINETLNWIVFSSPGTRYTLWKPTRFLSATPF